MSCRAMPKRPCAVVLSSDESTIICADKFGDLYSLPLLIPRGSVNQDYPSPTASKPFTPAANDLTVHTIRNRKALENQLRLTQQAAEKPEAHSGQMLLLGHVSMLTDITLVTLGGRSYIVTADRDEHIRISRGIPQAHIIENYCLGHTEFVSRLCVPSAYPNLLISGGGEDEIYVWDWLAGDILQKVDIRGQLSRDILETDQDLDAAVNVDVTSTHPYLPTNIVVANISHIAKGQNMQSDQIVVACEG
jgi:tRNA (guanine-N(7)-)-methyltransferase subunit TRM82